MNDHRIDPFIEALAIEGDQTIMLREQLASMVLALHNAMCVNSYLRHQIDAIGETPRVSGAAIIAQVCSEFGVSVRQLRGPGHNRKLSPVRREAYVRLAQAGFSRTDTGRLLNVDSTSVVNGLKVASGWKRPPNGPPRTDLWTEEESKIAEKRALGLITTAQAVELLPRRSLQGIQRRVRQLKGPRK